MKKIFLVSAEQSAELYASKIVNELRKRINISVTGVGGDNLKSTGAELLLRAEDVSVVGIIEVFSHFFKIKDGLKECVNWIKENMPEMVILFDFPDFNFWLIKKIREFYKGKIVYIISPQIWAWRKNRKYFIKKYVDKMIVILPFEKKIYDDIGFAVEFLGHPLVDIVIPDKSIDEFKNELGTKQKNKLISVFPGSRKKEILYHSEILKKSIENLKKKYSDIEFVIVSANTSCYEIIKNIFIENSRIHIINGDAYNAINASHVVIAKSGTVTLEAALLEKPAVVFYKVNTLSYIIGKIFVDVKYVALPNILLNKNVYPEYLQHDFNVENVTASVERYLEDPDLYVETVEQLQNLKKQLGEKGFFERVANKIVEWLYEE